MKNERKRVLLLALVIDLLLGDPPNRYHPVVAMGNFIKYMRRLAPGDDPEAEFKHGALAVGGGLALFGLAGRLIEVVAGWLPGPLGTLLQAAFLKSTFALRSLTRASDQIEAALQTGDLPQAQQLLSFHLVSRDTSQLDASQVSAATIESIAESTSDGLVAPLLYYAWGGLPASFGYRYVNTMDSLWGYRDREYEWLGKSAARLDDVLNYAPARLTAGLYLTSSEILRENRGQALDVLQQDARTTESPNAGYPMSAMAGALGVELSKDGHYRLGKGLRKPAPADIGRAKGLFLLSAALGTLLFLLLPGRKRR